MSLSTKAYRVVMSCKTPEQARVAYRWLILASKRDSRIKGLLPYYASQLERLAVPLPARLALQSGSSRPLPEIMP